MNDAAKIAIPAEAARPGQVGLGPAGALEAIGQAADWAARTVLAEVGDDDAAAFECVVALDEALPHVAGLLGQVPELLRAASPGDVVSSRLAAAEADFGRQQSALTAERGRARPRGTWNSGRPGSRPNGSGSRSTSSASSAAVSPSRNCLPCGRCRPNSRPPCRKLRPGRARR